MRVSAAVRTAVLARVAEQQPQYATFSGRAKTNLTINEKDQYDVTAQVRMVRDEAIWISVTAVMGIEVARLLITPDSIKIINRLRAEYVQKPFSYLHQFVNSDVDFLNIQQLLLGGVAHQLGGDDVTVWQGSYGYVLQKETNGLQYEVRLDNDYQNSYTSIAEPDYGQRLEASYADYQASASNPFPYQMEISIAAPRLTLQSEMKYSKAAYDEKVELPFSIPPRYTEVQ